MEVRKEVVVGEDTFRVRKLSWKSLEKAQQARATSQAGHLRALGGDILKALRSDELEEVAKSLAAKKTPEELAKARYDSYDREEILVAGIETRNGEAMSRESIIAELDKPTAEALHREIVDLSDPAPEAVEAAQGKR